MKVKFLTVLSIAAVLFIAACGGKSDADLQKAVSDKMTAENVAGVTVAVKDGVATLTGEVADAAVKTKAQTAATGVEGIKSVTNSLTLKPLPTATPAGDDKKVEGTINETLKKKNITGLTVTVSGGKATVKGKLADKSKLAEVAMSVQEAGASFDNQIDK